MKITAIIAEYNPLHLGHQYHAERSRAIAPCDALVVVMNGYFSERGDVMTDAPDVRANWAIEAGADLVLENPTVLALSTADAFALGAVKTLRSAFPADDVTLSFGSECGDVSRLRATANILQNENEEFSTRLKAKLKEGKSFPRSRAEVFCELYPELADVVDKPNNVLALEYLKHGSAAGFDFVTVQREDNYNSIETTGKYASATAIRNMLERGESVKGLVPDFVTPTRRDCSALFEEISNALRQTPTDELREVPEVREGLENRIKRLCNLPYEEYLAAVKTKRFTMAAMKRIALSNCLGLTKELLTRAKNASALPATVLAKRAGFEVPERAACLPADCAETASDILAVEMRAKEIFELTKPL